MAIFDRFKRQSAPKPTAEEYLATLPQNGYTQNGDTLTADQVMTNPIDEGQIKKATEILEEYKKGKATLEQHIVDNEKWYRMRHWRTLKQDASSVKPVSGWLFNMIANKHAEVMDNFPRPNILPREAGDKPEAEMLSDIIPVVLDQAEFEQTYSDVQLYKIKSGTGVYGVFWDPTKLNGLGDITVEKIDLLNLYWEPGVMDIQDSRNLFFVQLEDNDALVEKYPQLAGKLGTSTLTITDYAHDDAIDTSKKSAVVDWYYKKNGTLQYCKFVNQDILYSTENNREMLYDHGKYPFVFDTLYTIEGSPAGFGFVDVGKSAQEYIDRCNQVILENALQGAKPRFFIRGDGSVNEEEFADLGKPFIHVTGNLGEESIRPINAMPLPSLYVEVINAKIDELKETTGNRDVNTGGSTGGVTAASGIAAMQEAASRLARDNNKAAYRAFRQVVLLVIELIRQFYDTPRQFRIVGQDGAMKFVTYDNRNIVPVEGDDGIREPVYDVEITAEKASPYSRMAQNELAKEIYGMGIFNPQMADQALACLEMMDFDDKSQVVERVAQNGTLFQMVQQLQQQMMMMAAMLDKDRNTNEFTAGLARQFGMEGQPMPAGGEQKKNVGEESPTTAKARERVAESTAV
jgi:hypothetical protein